MEKGHGEDLSHPGDGPQAMEGVRVVDLGTTGQEELKVADHPVEAIGGGEADGDILLDTGLGERAGPLRPASSVTGFRGADGKILLVAGVLDMGNELGAHVSVEQGIPRGVEDEEVDRSRMAADAAVVLVPAV